MVFKFNPDVNWKKYTINWLLDVIAIVIIGIITFYNMFEFYSIQLIVAILLQVLLVVFGITRVMYYFSLPNKVYLKLEEDYISMYRPNLVSKNRIEHTHIKRVVEMNDIILLVMENGKEEQIRKEWLTEEDTMVLKNELKTTFGEKVIFT
ncbi:hypothetical protein SAMN04487943_107105 [Gracilibacillus orientalis]|uniref:Uncharacterized protein n=1 Tax=Gracilibacillus orientalis TaxID=334253 RepID=A0A1I4MV88_9BACI|nr:hypothetical protein [Gracilibacillus orientalis]SFM06960.1 hypothetical protein SAMN04487943_107105 [Gracilibacillus orientalis]